MSTLTWYEQCATLNGDIKLTSLPHIPHTSLFTGTVTYSDSSLYLLDALLRINANDDCGMHTFLMGLDPIAHAQSLNAICHLWWRCTFRDYVLKFVLIGDAAVGKSSLLVRLTDERFLTNPDATVLRLYSAPCNHIADKQLIPILFLGWICTPGAMFVMILLDSWGSNSVVNWYTSRTRTRQSNYNVRLSRPFMRNRFTYPYPSFN
jgi:Ras family